MLPVLPLLLLLLLQAGKVPPAAPGEEPDDRGVVWTYRFEEPIAGRPASHRRWIAVATRSGRLILLESGNPTPVRQIDLTGSAATGPRFFGPLLVAATGDRVVAWENAAADRRWSRTLPGRPAAPLSAGGDGSIWVPLDNGRLVALSGADGTILDEKEFHGRPATAAVRCRDRLIMGTADGRLLGFAPRSAAPAWERACGEAAPSTPVCDGRSVLAGCGNSLIRLGLSRGKVRWRYRVGARVAARPLVSGRHILFGSFDNRLYLLKRNNGHLVRTASSSHRVRLDPVPVGTGVLFLPDTAGTLEFYRLPGLDPAGRVPLPAGAGHPCGVPTVVGPELIAVACGEDRGFLHLVRPPPMTAPADLPEFPWLPGKIPDPGGGIR